MTPGRLHLDLVRDLEASGCAQIVGRHSEMLAQARQARLASEFEQEAQARAEAPGRRFRLGWRLPFLRVAR